MFRSRVSRPSPKSGMHHHRAVQVLGQLQIQAVEAQDVVDAGPVGGEDLARVERVDADGEARGSSGAGSPPPTSSNFRSSEHPRSMTSAPLCRKYSAARTICSRRGTGRC